MKKAKIIMPIAICVVILFSLLSFVGCNKDDMYSIDKFYGEYSLPFTKYFEVEFYCNEDNRSVSANIIGVKQNSYIYEESDVFNRAYIEKDFDRLLLAELDKFFEYMGDHVELSRDSIYFKDSRQQIKYDSKKTYWDESFGYLSNRDRVLGNLYYRTENYSSLKYCRNVRVLKVHLSSHNVSASDGTTWSIYVSREYKQYM